MRTQMLLRMTESLLVRTITSDFSNGTFKWRRPKDRLNSFITYLEGFDGAVKYTLIKRLDKEIQVTVTCGLASNTKVVYDQKNINLIEKTMVNICKHVQDMGDMR